MVEILLKTLTPVELRCISQVSQVKYNHEFDLIFPQRHENQWQNNCFPSLFGEHCLWIVLFETLLHHIMEYPHHKSNRQRRNAASSDWTQMHDRRGTWKECHGDPRLIFTQTKLKLCLYCTSFKSSRSPEYEEME